MQPAVDSKFSSLPALITLEVQHEKLDATWKIVFPDFYHSLIVGEEGAIDQKVLQHLLTLMQVDTSLRKQVYLKAVALLVGVFPQQHEVRIYSPRLNYELTMMDYCIKSAEQLTESQQLFKEHVEQVALINSKEFITNSELATLESDLVDLEGEKFKQVESVIEAQTQKLLAHMRAYKTTLFEKVTDWGLGITANYALVRVHLLKFVALLPSLDHDHAGDEVRRLFVETLRRLITDNDHARVLKKSGQEKPLPNWMIGGIKLTKWWAQLFPAKMVAWVIRSSIRKMARRFIAGETIELATKSLKELYATGRDVTLDQLGELVVSKVEADHYCNEVIKLIRGFALHVPQKGQKNSAGINRAHVSIKVSALSDDFKPFAPDYTYAKVAPRLKKILLAAKEEQVFLNIDAEHYDYRDMVFKIYKRVLLETPELHDYQQTGIVVQAYLRDAAKHLDDIIALAKERGISMPIRLVKGAYWDAETFFAEAHSFDPPEFLNKEESDIMFRQIVVKTFENWPHVQLALASHNFSDHVFAHVVQSEHYPELPPVEHQCLHMTYEALSYGMNEMGWAVRNYIPVGSLLVGMAYLVRRIMENSSQVGVLTIMRSHKKNLKVLTPNQVHREKIERGDIIRDFTQTQLTAGFFNIAPVKLFVDEQRYWVEKALEEFKQEGLGKAYINRFAMTGDWVDIVSSSDPNTVVGKICFAHPVDADKAMQIAQSAYESGKWATLSARERASYLLKAANIMATRRNQLASLIMYEAGKAVKEALADVDEAIDFLNYYAREEVRILEENRNLISRGVVAVIAPWNFPLAIPTGMSVGALVAGNSVVLKSAKTTPLIAQELTNIIHEAGVPEEVFIHLPGNGSAIGDVLVNHQFTAQVIFTGSKGIGMRIGHGLSKKMVNNRLFNVAYPARATTEMGGKNAIIVTANAELDETVAGILYSAFGHSGQKCSAASRVIVDNRIKSRLIERLKEGCNDQFVGEAYNFASSLNPVITAYEKKRLQDKVAEAVEEAKRSGGNVLVDRSQEELPGYCIGPAIIELPYEQAMKPESIARLELFGPVVHLVGFDTLEQAIELFNVTEYALTGGVFSQSQDDIDYLTKRMEVGNIYVNRPITGARVAIEPFGGFKLSGTGPKAGGDSYIRHFHVDPVNEQSIVHADLNEEQGAEYDFDLCRASQLTNLQRVRKVGAALEEILNDYESLFQEVGGNKQYVEGFLEWIKNSFVSMKEDKKMNRIIPGQTSYNDHQLIGEKALIVSYKEIPDIRIFQNFIALMINGVGTTVACRSMASYNWWGTIKNYFIYAGISKFNFDVYFASEEKLGRILATPDLSYIIVDGMLNKVKHVANKTFTGKYDEVVSKKLVSSFDTYAPGEYFHLCEQYCWTRSFAINTMRYGAPLELDL